MVHINVLANIDQQVAWGHNWLWGLPLIMVTVLIHVLGISMMLSGIAHFGSYIIQSRRRGAIFGTIVAGATLGATVLLGIETVIWPFAYRFLKALPDHRAAMLYSLNAITSFGHTDVQLAYVGNFWEHWSP